MNDGGAEELGRGCRVMTVEKVKSLINEVRKSILDEAVVSLSRSISEDLKNSLTAELSTALKASLTATFTEIIENRLEPIQGEITEIKNELSAMNEVAALQTAEIEKLKQENNILLEKLSTSQDVGTANKINQIEERIEERTNRSLRQTLVFKGIKEQKIDVKNFKGKLVTVSERWSDTTDILSEVIATACDLDAEDTRDWINRAHRSAPNPRKEGKRDIYANFFSWEVTQQIIKGFREYNISNNDFKVFVDYKYGPLTTARRNEALKLRSELKRERAIVKGYVNYPAKLMVLYPGESRFTEHSDFSKKSVTFKNSKSEN